MHRPKAGTFPVKMHDGPGVGFCGTDPMLELKRTPFHERTSKLSLPQNWRRWAGYIVIGSYELSLDREYWAIRDAAALIDVSPLMKYLIDGPDAALLLHRVTTRDVLKMAVGQVS